MSDAPQSEPLDPSNHRPTSEAPDAVRAAATDQRTLAASGNSAPPRGVEPIGLALTISAEVAGHDAEPGWDASRLPVIERESYEIAGEVGQGGIGRVLRAADTRLNRPVALKELLDSAGPAAEERFVREALLTARLQHPSIVPLYEAGRWPSGAPFYAMKLVSGRSLADVIEQSRTLDERLGLLPHVLAVAEAMAYAHSEQIIHRDLKPANVLVGAFGETVVIDWGLAKDLALPELDPAPPRPAQAPVPSSRTPTGRTPPGEALTIHGAVMGTPAYMPVEQARGERVDERADVYALGAILYHLLAGSYPYEGDTGAAVLRTVLARPPQPLGERQRGIAEDLLAIVHKAMARDKAARYPSAKELADDLRRFQTGQIVGAHRYSRGELVLRFARRYRAALSVAAAALAVLAITGTIGIREIMAESRLAREKQAIAEQAEHRALERADDLTLVHARGAVERDPNQSLAWLKTLSPGFERWPEARLIAADAHAQGLSTVLRGHSALINGMVYSHDGRWLATASDDSTLQVWDLAQAAPGGGERPLTAGAPRILKGHSDEVWAVAFSPDARLLASASKDRSVRIWDLESGTSRVLAGHGQPVSEVMFAGPDLVVSGSDDGTARLWDVKTGEPRGVLGGPEIVRSIAVSRDGRTLAAGGHDKLLYLQDLASGQVRALAGHEAEIAGVAISADGKLVATRDRDGMVRLWDVQSGASRVLSPRVANDTALLPPFGKVRFSPDGSMLATVGEGNFVRLFDLASGAERKLTGVTGQTTWVVFSPDSKLVAVASLDHTARVWDLGQGGSRAFRGFENAVMTLAFSPDGKALAAASADGTARLFPLDRSASRTLGATGTRLSTIAISPDQEHLVAPGADGTIHLWHLGSGAEVVLEGHEGPVYLARFSPDGQLVASAGDDGTTRLWDLEGHLIWSVGGRSHALGSSLAFSPDGQLVASPGGGGAIQLLDVGSGAVRELVGHPRVVTSALFSPDGTRLASGSLDGTLRVWDLASGASRVFAGHELAVLTAVFSPDGKTLASGANDHTMRLWDVASGASRKLEARGGGISQIVFSADGKTAFTADSYETGTRIWDVAAGVQRATLTGHRGLVLRLSLSPDDSRLVTASTDGTLRLWDLGGGTSRILRGHTDGVADVAFAPDGKLIASAGADGTVLLWRDDLPDEPAALRAWIDAAIPDTVDPRVQP